MSEFTQKQQERKNRLLAFCTQILKIDKPLDAVEKNRDIMDTVTAEEVIWVVDEMVKQFPDMENLKTGINKILNLFHKSLQNKAETELPENSFLYYLKVDNDEMDEKLKMLKPMIRQVNKEELTETLRKDLTDKFTDLLAFDAHYTIKENILFPFS